MTDRPDPRIQECNQMNIKSPIPQIYQAWLQIPQQVCAYLEEKGEEFSWGYGGLDGVYFKYYLHDVPVKVYEDLIVPHIEDYLNAQSAPWDFIDNGKREEHWMTVSPNFIIKKR